MYNSCFGNIFIGKYLTYLPSCHSTNDIAAELSKQGAIQEGHVVITDFQSAGRGQRGATWASNKGLNLLLSIYLKPHFIPVQEQFSLSMAMALGVCRFLQLYTSPVTVKWPNDVYIGPNKCAGILIENVVGQAGLQRSIVGIGININQTLFEHPKATSLATTTGRLYELNELLCPLLNCLEQEYLQLANTPTEQLKNRYLSALLGFQQKRLFSVDNHQFYGTIVDVTSQGLLVLEDEEHRRTEYNLKEIQWI